ncbi:MAG: O-antigen ligase family protein [Caldilineaceae bacterium]|nr:O-antigen ligase family protein [Caldilineaceae bacterium]
MRIAASVERESQFITQIIQRGGQALILALPLWIDPWAALPFEPAKAALLRWGVVALTLIALLGIGISAEVRRIFARNLRQTWPFAATVLLYLGCIALSTAFSLSPRQSLWGLSDGHGLATLTSMILLWALLVASQRTERDQTALIDLLLAGSAPICLYALIQAAGLDPLTWRTDSVSPVHSTLGRSNFLGAYLAVLLPLTLYRLHCAWIAHPRSRDRRVLRLAVLLSLQTLCLLFSLARAAWLAAAAGAWIFFWLMPNPRRKKAILMIGVAAILALTVLVGDQLGRSGWFASTDRSTEIHASAENAEYAEVRTESLARRVLIWRATLPLIAERPLLGYGPEIFVTVFNERYPPGSLYAGRDTLVDDPHNQLLETLMAAGLVGMIAWLVLLGVLGWGLIVQVQQQNGQRQRVASACLAALVAYGVQAQFNPDVIAVSMLFWIVAAVSLIRADR